MYKIEHKCTCVFQFLKKNHTRYIFEIKIFWIQLPPTTVTLQGQLVKATSKFFHGWAFLPLGGAVCTMERCNWGDSLTANLNIVVTIYNSSNNTAFLAMRFKVALENCVALQWKTQCRQKNRLPHLKYLQTDSPCWSVPFWWFSSKMQFHL